MKKDTEMERLNRVSNSNRPEGYHNVEHKPQAHTPTPWKYHLGRGANPRFHIQTEGGYQIASTPELDSLSKEENEGREKDAAFIVRAVNCHEELVQLLKNVRKQLAQNVYEVGQPGTWATMLDDKIVGAIAKAEGK